MLAFMSAVLQKKNSLLVYSPTIVCSLVTISLPPSSRGQSASVKAGLERAREHQLTQALQPLPEASTERTCTLREWLKYTQNIHS